QAARDIVARWASHDAGLLTCEDLSSPGWRHRLFDPSASRAVVGGQVVRARDIRGVLVRRPWIIEQELAHMDASDREYAGAEMNAFLLSWLASLPCRVLNRPSGTSLCGPNWRPLQWAHAAACAGIPVETAQRRVPARRKRSDGVVPGVSQPPVEVTLVGDRCFGDPDNFYAAGVRRLAAIANVGLLAVRFMRGEPTPHFVSATAMPSLKDPEVAQAVCDYLSTETAAGESA
ncbi:MAG TPA: hypothetical protein VGV35_08835, partial [Bryobacteraceae bacterium]|nr:hypothetical protein [Bryobacteraceae bacterium]